MSEGDVVIARLGSLAAAMRAQGSRVGVGELLGAHQALLFARDGGKEQRRAILRWAG